MNSQIKLQLNYFQKAVFEIEESLRVFYWAQKNNPAEHNKRYPACLIPFDYLDRYNTPKEEYYDLLMVFLFPRHTGISKGRKIFYVDLDELIKYSEESKDWLLQQISKLQNFQNPQRNELIELMNLSSKTQSNSHLRKPKWGELRKNCQEIATIIGLEEETELTKDDVKLVCEELEKRGFAANPKSVASTLRHKLGYHKYKV